MTPAAAKRLRLLGSALSIILLVGVLTVAWFYWRMHASLPQLEGTAQIAGLTGPVTVERDALGVPTIRGRDRRDVARATGWVHAQDRFFQMDLLRRSAAGEIAELFGKRVLGRDRAIRMHGFRRLAEKVMMQLDPGERAILDAYTTGVNAGLAALPSRPFEYLLLGNPPVPWRPEDSVLVLYAMYLDLQDETGRYEHTLMTLRDQLGLEGVAFFNPLALPVDAALDGTDAPLPPVPGPRMLDLRGRKMSTYPFPIGPGSIRIRPSEFPPFNQDLVPGSNAFALAGRHTASGGAIVANDMHLEHGVPNIWYRATLEYPAGGDTAGAAVRRVTGVTLPGTPLVAAGTNGRVAWGFTNANADTSDLVVIETLPDLPSWYVTPDQPSGVKMERRPEVIRVKGGGDVPVEYSWTIWGPVVGRNDRGRPLALRWVAHDLAAANLRLIGMEDAANVDDAIAVAHMAGIPAQNCIIADANGDIAWTIAGRLPKRIGYDGRLPVSWAFGDRRWDGLLPAEQVPVVSTKSRPGGIEAKDGRIWSANNRHLGGDGQTAIGDGNYSLPHRAGQIRDGIASLARATPRDLLAVQLDTRAIFLEPWHRLLMDTLTPAAAAASKSRALLRGFAEKWEGHASVDAVSYRLVREFRIAVYTRAFSAIFANCVADFPDFVWSELQLEPAMWAMLREKPAHLLNPEFTTWDDLLLAGVDDVIAQLNRQGVTLPYANWGWRNTARIRHPFGNLVPAWMSGWLSMPADPLPGDSHMPRVQAPTHGASQRLVVTPGRENEGIFHMPTGQSAHPLSPFFRAGHADWVKGAPSPLLPGATRHTLRLEPAAR